MLNSTHNLFWLIALEYHKKDTYIKPTSPDRKGLLTDINWYHPDKTRLLIDVNWYHPDRAGLFTDIIWY